MICSYIQNTTKRNNPTGVNMSNIQRRKNATTKPMASYAQFTGDGFCIPIVRRYGAWALNIAIKGHRGNLPDRHAMDFSIISRWIDGNLVTRYQNADEHVKFSDLAEPEQELLFNLAIARLRHIKQHDSMPNPAPFGNGRTTGAVASQYEHTTPIEQGGDDADEYAFLDEPIDADLEPAI